MRKIINFRIQTFGRFCRFPLIIIYRGGLRASSPRPWSVNKRHRTTCGKILLFLPNSNFRICIFPLSIVFLSFFNSFNFRTVLWFPCTLSYPTLQNALYICIHSFPQELCSLWPFSYIFLQQLCKASNLTARKYKDFHGLVHRIEERFHTAKNNEIVDPNDKD